MIATAFEYTQSKSLNDALQALAEGAKPLAGGMSLVPMMKLRLAAPEHLIDLARIPELRYVREEGNVIRIGATSTHFDVQTSTVLRRTCSLLPKTAAEIGDVQIRHQGTIGGSIAHNDPAADYPAALMALEAQVKLQSAQAERVVAYSDFVVDAFTTLLEPDELVTEVIVPSDGPSTGTSYIKFAQAASGFAMAGAAARVRRENGKLSMVRVGLTGIGAIAYRAKAVEEALEGTAGTEPEILKAAALAADGVEANSDIHASATYRAHLAKVCAARAIRAALAEIAE